jgi:hypothetical protein
MNPPVQLIYPNNFVLNLIITMNSVPVFQKQQNRHPDANWFGHTPHPSGWESTWALFLKSSDASKRPGIRMEGNGFQRFAFVL